MCFVHDIMKPCVYIGSNFNFSDMFYALALKKKNSAHMHPNAHPSSPLLLPSLSTSCLGRVYWEQKGNPFLLPAYFLSPFECISGYIRVRHSSRRQQHGAEGSGSQQIDPCCSPVWTSHHHNCLAHSVSDSKKRSGGWSRVKWVAGCATRQDKALPSATCLLQHLFYTASHMTQP